VTHGSPDHALLSDAKVFGADWHTMGRRLAALCRRAPALRGQSSEAQSHPERETRPNSGAPASGRSSCSLGAGPGAIDDTAWASSSTQQVTCPRWQLGAVRSNSTKDHVVIVMPDRAKYERGDPLAPDRIHWLHLT
jgi:hypothetical protein